MKPLKNSFTHENTDTNVLDHCYKTYRLKNAPC